MISYNGFNSQHITMPGSIAETGIVVKFDEHGCVNANTGDVFDGVCVKSDDTYSSVQVEGYIECKYTGTAPGYGYKNLVASTNGAVKVGTDANGPMRRVLKVDTTNKIVGFIL